MEGRVGTLSDLETEPNCLESHQCAQGFPLLPPDGFCYTTAQQCMFPFIWGQCPEGVQYIACESMHLKLPLNSLVAVPFKDLYISVLIGMFDTNFQSCKLVCSYTVLTVWSVSLLVAIAFLAGALYDVALLSL